MTNKKRLFSIALAAGLALGLGARPASAQRSSAAAGDTTARAPARAILRMDIKADPRARGVYVGEAMPVTIRALFLGGTGVTLNGQPRVTSDALLLSDLSEKPTQSSVQLHGLPYTALTWTGALTAIKAGATSVAIELPVELSYREMPRPGARGLGRRGAPADDSAGGDGGDGDQNGQDDAQDDPSATSPFASMLRGTPFESDPFFAQMFRGRDPFAGMLEDLGGTIRQREVTLHDQRGSLRVLDLPPGRPPGFSGAVGSFEIGAALADPPFRVGEPTSLELRVRGQGSFSRLSVAGLPPTDDLGAYGMTSTFTPGPTPIMGEKVFTQTIAPRRAGPLTIPAVALTYFDPHEERYVTRHTAPLDMTVLAGSGDADGVRAPTTSPPAATTGGAASGAGRASGAATTSVPDVVRSTLTPSFRARWFWWLAAAIGFATLALTTLGRAFRRGVLARARAATRLRRAIAREQRAVGDAAARGDAVALFGAARRALQARLGAKWGLPSEAIAAADVAARLGSRGDRIREVFERADRCTYSGGGSGSLDDLKRWQTLVSDELHTLEGST